MRILHSTLRNCLMCGQEPRSAVLLPCKHLALCDGCCQQMLQEQQQAAAAAAGAHRHSKKLRVCGGSCQCPICGAAVFDSITGVILPM